ncbi:hypothetical protein K440DRAFT_664567 [Wilcoxina mikolae CBS 423.85]|nr:hypothetical protein K440DRAFT_664567 [Wilcoxina mikolae CBS 423.85]
MTSKPTPPARDPPCGITVLYPTENEHGSGVSRERIAIHGLNGHALETWTHQKSRVLWLRDLLPDALPNSRIMTYGYNAKFKNFTALQDLGLISKKLLSELADIRKDKESSERPLVLICHSLGGIVAKQMLSLHTGQPEFKKVQDSVYGIMFMGTPHNGSSLAGTGALIANIVAACSSFSPAQKLLSTLRKDSKVLYQISEDFISKTPKLELVSFYEMNMTNVFRGLIKRVVVDRQSACLNLPNEVAIGQYADHRDLARFLSKDDINYRPVQTRLVQFHEDILHKMTVVQLEVSEATTGIRASQQYFEIPFAPCHNFTGREELLAQMETYFLHSPGPQKLLIYVLTGLGGSGKTQTALRYAHQHQNRPYRKVFFFNADSLTTLRADFARVFKLLKLGNSDNTSDKVSSVKRWLATEDNTDWLLIFDNADQLASVNLERFFPTAPWGHIIVTTRDPTGSFGEESHMQGLKPEEAVQLLLKRSKILKPTDDDIVNATCITEQLGCLALAIEQAGAYISARQLTLQEYVELLQCQRNELLKYPVQLGSYQRSVFATWEVSFRQIERDSTPAAKLLLMLSFLDPAEINQLMLVRGCQPQKRWGAAGEVCNYSASEAGVDSGIIELVTNRIVFDDAIQKLREFSLIQRNYDVQGKRSFSLHPLVQDCVSHRVGEDEQRKWREQAILLVSQAFPRHQYLEDKFGDLGRMMLPHVSRCMKEYERINQTGPPISKATKCHMAALLIASSRFSDNSWKWKVVGTAQQILSDDGDPYLHGWATQRKSSLLRMQGKMAESNRTLEECIHSTIFPCLDNQGVEKERRWNAQRGELVVSFADNLIMNGNTALAEKELREWEPLSPEPISAMELMVLRNRNTTLAKIFREERRFEESIVLFEKVLDESRSDKLYDHTGNRMIILSNLADLYLETGRTDDAYAILIPGIELMRSRGTLNISAGRRLNLALSEVYIRQGLLDKAEKLLLELQAVVELDKDPDMISKSAMFRVWSGLARIAHTKGLWRDALNRWQRALVSGEHCGWAEDKHPLNVVHYSLADVYDELDLPEDSRKLIQQAKESLEKEGGKKFWMVGIATYWLEYVEERMKSKEEYVLV